MRSITVTNDCGETFTIKVGDFVGFKSDIEQYGGVTEIRKRSWGGYELVIANEGGFIGEYIGGKTTTTMFAEDVWVD